MKLYFYVGGPRALPRRNYWSCRDTRFPGCKVAFAVGADIPADTYVDAKPGVSQCDTGFNATAILPLEFET